MGRGGGDVDGTMFLVGVLGEGRHGNVTDWSLPRDGSLALGLTRVGGGVFVILRTSEVLFLFLGRRVKGFD